MSRRRTWGGGAPKPRHVPPAASDPAEVPPPRVTPPGGRGGTDLGLTWVRGREQPWSLSRKKRSRTSLNTTKLSQIVTVIQTYQKPRKQYKLNTNKINTMEDRRAQGDGGRGGHSEILGFFSFLLRPRGHPGPRFGVGHTQGGQSKGPWRHLPPHPHPRDLLLSSDTEFNFPPPSPTTTTMTGR